MTFRELHQTVLTVNYALYHIRDTRHNGMLYDNVHWSDIKAIDKDREVSYAVPVTVNFGSVKEWNVVLK